ncbi:MAG TPA: hypothetical protein DHV62_04540, partial [Elusimicrobia bacterium]|nr:hypothetical protein [Elusimicrobiota bacterium]
MKNLKRIYYVVILGLILYLGSPRGGTWFYIHNIRWLYVFFLSLFLANFITPIVQKIAARFKILDYPDERKIHRQPIPLLGGLAIYLAFIITVVRNLNFSRELWGVVLGGTIVFLFGLIDDLRGLSAKIRFLGQIFATLLIIAFGIRVTVIPHWTGEYILEVLVTILGVVGITNAMNFFDGMDGLATGLSVV